MVEIIEFKRPTESEKNLYLTNIPRGFEEYELSESLYNIFSKYGLLFEVQVIPGCHHKTKASDSSMATAGEEEDSGLDIQYFAFVKYFSAVDAFNAKNELSGRLVLKGRLTRIRFASRNKSESTEKYPLFISKCYELANHHLGFSGWTIKIVNMQNESDLLTEPGGLRFVCVVRLDITGQELQSYGFAASQQTWDTSDPTKKSVGLCKARKQAYQFAVQDAFSKVLIVKLPNGKLFTEVNTTVEEKMQCNHDLDQESLLKVNVLAEAPSLDDSDDDVDIDVLNQHILEDLDGQC